MTGSVARGAIPLDEIFEINPYDASWIGNVSLGVQLERGNTVRTGGDVNLALRRRFEISRIQLTAGYSGIRGNNDDGESVTEKRQLWGGIQFDRFVTPKWFWFAHSNAERDGLADLDLRLITGGGFGYQILDTRRFDMSVRSGLNWVHERYSPDTGSGDYPAGMLRWEVRGKLTDLLAFEHIGEWIPSLDDFGNNQLIRTQVALRQMLYKQWFGEVRLAWQLNTEPAEDAKRQDTSYVLALGWGF